MADDADNVVEMRRGRGKKDESPPDSPFWREFEALIAREGAACLDEVQLTLFRTGAFLGKISEAAAVLGMEEDELVALMGAREDLRPAYERGKQIGRHMLRQRMMFMALQDEDRKSATSGLIWLSKNELGYSDRNFIEQRKLGKVSNRDLLPLVEKAKKVLGVGGEPGATKKKAARKGAAAQTEDDEG